MKILALILARGGSKRLPAKNMRLLDGKPLVAWSLAVAKRLPEITNFLVSTDSREISETGRDEGALVPWLRPAHLSSDAASSVDAAIHALDWYESVYGRLDGLLLLQPTSPFRSLEALSRAIELFQSEPSTPVVSVSPAHHHPNWCFVQENDKWEPIGGWDALRQRSQDLKPAYNLNGSIYIVSAESLRYYKSFVSEGFRPILSTSQIEGLDIDTEYDWMIAEEAVRRGLVKAPWRA